MTCEYYQDGPIATMSLSKPLSYPSHPFHSAVNPSDTEESIWAFLCEAQMPSIGFDKARKEILRVGR